MALNPLQILSEAQALGAKVSLAQVQAAISSIDRTAYEQAERLRYRYEIWDEKSPLAGQPPEYWRQRGDWPEGGKVYLLYIDDRLVYVQPHDPEQSGLVPMTEETARARAEAQIARFVEAAVDEKVRQEVLLKLLQQQ